LTHGPLDFDALVKMKAFDWSRISDAVARPLGDVISEQGPDEPPEQEEEAEPILEDRLPGSRYIHMWSNFDEFKVSHSP
jgi:hypothetical protein